ncbi:MAG TPA: GDYXXLXY domain-containing protein [Quisquiliibacterium sp.]|nr:MAG: hypothetical protein E6Q93_20480 [Burkholderiaceae bacterium]HPA91926.1 GDYXXLXY domain-containing protein [Quisquiliibacterium sp.]HQD84088.1 GDYXXLXY domain-containing protein [Quisquiliibacterium sp.]HQN10942.1 GDYXXLXY domain-containing protein [Quisquiliibacterium sp.]
MMRRWPLLLALLGAVLVLVLYNGAVLDKERLLRDGRLLRLELAPRDPRALLTGDYMALNYTLARALEARLDKAAPQDGIAIVRPDARGVAQLQRVQRAPVPRADDELPVRFRVRGHQVRIGTNAWYFEEGSAKTWERARFGVFRVDADGELLLTGLLDEALQPLH